MKKSFATWLGIGLLALVGCAGTPPEEPDVGGLELTQTHVITGFGFSIAYPDGWQADTRGTLTAISQVERDHEQFFRGSPGLEGVQITLDHRNREFMTSIGLPEDATLAELVAFNTEQFNWKDVEPEEAEVFGAPVLRASLRVGIQRGVEYMGFVGDEVILFGVAAPTQEMLDDFMPVFDAMVESIEPVSE